MNFSILRAFLEDQRKAKRIVSERLNVSVDISGMVFSRRQREIKDAYRRAPFADVFYPHGGGLELRLSLIHI